MKKKRKINKSAFIILGIVIFCLVVPNISYAFNIGEEILLAIGGVVQYLFNWILKAAAATFEGVLDIGFKKHIGVIQSGWKVVRDVANMFFVLFLVIIAFATILRNEQYGAKKLLPKLIIIALLINFSFVLSGAVVDFSNITASLFINNIRGKITGDHKGAITATFTDSLNLTGAIVVMSDCEKYRETLIEKCNLLSNWPTPYRSSCLNAISEKYEECQKAGMGSYVNEEAIEELGFLNILLSTIVGSIVILIAAFVLFAGAAMLLIRIVAISLLLVIAPIALITIIMPGLSSNWKKWLNSFLKWCFFAPIYAFFVWLATEIASTRANEKMTAMMQNTPLGTNSAVGNEFILDPGAQLISYGIIIAFLIGGIIAAQELGIAGAKTTIKIGKDWGNKLSGISKAKNYMAMRKKIKGEEKKTSTQRRMRLREATGIKQKIKMKLPGEKGRRARIAQREIIKKEAKRMSDFYTERDLERILGERSPTRFKRSSRIAAALVLSDTKKGGMYEKVSRKGYGGKPLGRRKETRAIKRLIKLEKTLSRFN